ncbi:MAG: hypothetical protein ACT4TC_11830, partial [Myxococcaceae bacterium]
MTALWMSMALVVGSFSTSDNFDDNSLGAFWADFTDPGVTALETNQRVEITSATGLGGNRYGIVGSAIEYDFRNATATVELVSAGNQGIASWAVQVLLRRGPDFVGFNVGNGMIAAGQRLAGANSTLFQTAYVPASMRVLRLRSVNGQLFWETSADGTTWGPFHNATPSLLAAPVALQLAAGTYLAEATQTTALFDNASFTTQSGPPTQFAFATSPRRFTVGACSSASKVVTVELRDATGDQTSAGAPRSFTIGSSSSGTFGFFSDVACTTQVASGTFTLQPGVRSVDIYYRDTRPGTAIFALSGTAPLAAPPSPYNAVAALFFADDFETGTVLGTETPQGAWDFRGTESAMSSLLATPAAAHRGSYGLRLVDGYSAAGTGFGTAVEQFVEGPDLYARYWVRMVSNNGLGNLIISATSDSMSHIHSIYLFPPFTDLEVAGFSSASSVFSSDGVFPGIGTGPWHLVETAVTGAGTASGRRRLWIDGSLVATSAVLELSGMIPEQVSLGEIWSDDHRFTGTVDFDDYRAGSTPHASRFSLVAPAQSAVGACTAITAALR